MPRGRGAQPPEQVAAQAGGWAAVELSGWRGVWPRFGDALDDLVAWRGVAWRGQAAAEEAAALAAEVQRGSPVRSADPVRGCRPAMVLLNCPVESATCGVDAKAVQSRVALQRGPADLRRDPGMTV